MSFVGRHPEYSLAIQFGQICLDVLLARAVAELLKEHSVHHQREISDVILIALLPQRAVNAELWCHVVITKPCLVTGGKFPGSTSRRERRTPTRSSCGATDSKFPVRAL